MPELILIEINMEQDPGFVEQISNLPFYAKALMAVTGSCIVTSGMVLSLFLSKNEHTRSGDDMYIPEEE